ncbi:uncharacterized protein [Amphiura filiformis]|uniref:uncharacterized protein n=1 Tax=Amphiura filiformis TaxID=82378 RepID=UPI003B21A8DE
MASSIDRAIFVIDIPFITEDVSQLKDKLELYFGKAKHGGGDIDTVICPVAGNSTKAIVVFESAQVAHAVVQYGAHTFEDEDVDVTKLPPIYSLVEVDLEQYYWDIVPREKASAFINSLAEELDIKNVSRHKLRGSYHQLESINKDILKLAGIGVTQGASAELESTGILDRSVEVANIPFLTDDVAKLKARLKDAIEQAGKVKVEGVISPIKGNMARAIVVFESTEDRDNYHQETTHQFDGEELKLHIPPKVFQISSISLEKFYTELIPKRKVASIHKQLTGKFGSEVSFNGTEIEAPFDNLLDVVGVWMEAAGLPQPKKSAATDIREKEDESGQQIEEEEENRAPQRSLSSEPEESWVKVNADGTEDQPADDEVGRLADDMQMLDISSKPEEVKTKRKAEESDDLQRSEDENDDVKDVECNRQKDYPLALEPSTPVDKPPRTDNIMGEGEEDSQLKGKEHFQKRKLSDTENDDTKYGQLPVMVPHEVLDDNDVVEVVNSGGNADIKKNGAHEETRQSVNHSDLPSVQSDRIGFDASGYTPPHPDATTSTQESDQRDTINQDSKTVDAYDDNDKPSTTSQDAFYNGADDNEENLMGVLGPNADESSRERIGNEKIGGSEENLMSSPSQNVETNNKNTSGNEETLMVDTNQNAVESSGIGSDNRKTGSTEENLMGISGQNATDSSQVRSDDKKPRSVRVLAPSFNAVESTSELPGGKDLETSGKTSQAKGPRKDESESNEIENAETPGQPEDREMPGCHDDATFSVAPITNKDTVEDSDSSVHNNKAEEILPDEKFQYKPKTSVTNLINFQTKLQKLRGSSEATEEGTEAPMLDNSESQIATKTTTSQGYDDETPKDENLSANKQLRPQDRPQGSLTPGTTSETNPASHSSKSSEREPGASVQSTGKDAASVISQDYDSTPNENDETPEDDADVQKSTHKGTQDNEQLERQQQRSQGDGTQARRYKDDVASKSVKDIENQEPDIAANKVLATKRGDLQREQSVRGKESHEKNRVPGAAKAELRSKDDHSATTKFQPGVTVFEKASTTLDEKEMQKAESSSSKRKPDKDGSTSKQIDHKQTKLGSKNTSSSSKYETSTEHPPGGSRLVRQNDLQTQSGSNSLTGSKLSAPEPKEAPDLSIEDYVSIDAITYKCLRKTSDDQLQKIRTKYNVLTEIQTPDVNKPADQIAVFKPQKKASKEDQMNAKEEFIKLYQDLFFAVKRVSLKCDGLPQNKAAAAQQETERRVQNVVIQKDTQGFLFCGKENDVQKAVSIFREAAGIQPKPRKLKRKTSSDFDADGSDEYYFSANQETRGRREGNVPSSFPSAFCSKEGLQMIILQDDITKQKVDIIVNAANGRLDHGGGVAGAISRAAGYQLQQDCNNFMYNRKPLQIGQCVDTKGYRLPCRYIIHAVGPVYQRQNSPDRANVFFDSLLTTFMNILGLAEAKGAQTIAIPLISSGNFGGPKTICANALASALYNFSSSPQRRNLQQIFLVNIDQEATTTLQSNFGGLFLSAEDKDEAQIESQSVLQQIPSKPAKYTTNEGIEVVVVQGDITKGSVEVIVNAANSKLLHGGGVAGAIAHAAGKQIQDECDRIISQRGRPLDVGECEVTEGYNLKRKVIHAVGPIYDKHRSDREFFDKLKKTFIAAIQHANLPIEAKQVALPLISSGIFGGPKQLCARALAEAVKEFSKNERNLVLKRIYLVNIDSETTDAVRRACGTFLAGGTPTGDDATREDHENLVPGVGADSASGFCLRSNKGIMLCVSRGDIVKQQVDVIVNPTSPTLRHDGGVAAAISDAAGIKLQVNCNHIFKEVRKNQPLVVGETVVTQSFNLQCSNIIHTLGPTFDRERPNVFCETLQQTYGACLQLANSTMKVKTIAFPLIASSTVPRETCAKAFADAIHELDQPEVDINLKKIIMVTKDDHSFTAVQNILSAYFSPQPTSSTGDVSTPVEYFEERFAEYVFKTAENMEIRVRTDDVAKQSTDVIFNYTDEKMTNAGTISKQLCTVAGLDLQKECNERLKKRKVFSKGNYLSTKGFQLPCKRVLHVSIPTEHGESDQDFTAWLTGVYVGCFLFAHTTLKAKTITVPLIDSGGSPDMSNVYATALASALKQFSKQIHLSRSSVTIYVVNIAPATTAVVRRVFSDSFNLVDDAKQMQAPTTIRKSNEQGRTPVITNQPARSQFRSPHDEPNKLDAASNNQAVPTYPRTSTKGGTLLSLTNTMNKCEICNTTKEKVHSLEGCLHKVCLSCIQAHITPNSTCQKCGSLYGWLTEPTCGGTMKYYKTNRWRIGGNDSIVLDFHIPSGIQNNTHPNPGGKFLGMTTTAYLPDTEEGLEVLPLIRWAFLNDHMFQISATPSGERDRLVIGDIPLKYRTHGGFINAGYPDSKYLPMVKKIVKEKQESCTQGDGSTEA